MVTACGADYHSRMPASASHVFHLIDRMGPGQRVIYRKETQDGSELLVMIGYRGSALPEVIGDSSIEYDARTVDRIEMRPALFERLHRPFALTGHDRFAARCLLALLRLPGGARLLRSWHARRSA